MCLCTCCITDEDSKYTPISEIVPNSKRKCTDAPCWLVLITFFAIEMYLIYYSVDQGAEPDTLTHGYDYKGEYCNDNHDQGSLNAWVNLEESFDFRICVESCEQTNGGRDDRMVVEYESEKYVNAYCIPTDSDKYEFSIFESFGSYGEELTRAMADVEDAKWMVVVCALLSILFGFGYIKIIEHVGHFIIWATVVLIYIGGTIAAWLLIANAVDLWTEDESSDIAGWQLLAGIIIIIALLIFTCLLVWLRKRIEMAIIMLDQAGDAINDMKQVLIFPVVYCIPVLMYLFFWYVIALLIYSVKESHSSSMPTWLTESDSSINSERLGNYIYYDWDEALRSTIIIHFICLAYSIEVITYFSYMVLCGAFADWYFSDWATGSQNSKIRGDRRSELGDWPVVSSFWRVLRFHVGSLAFGASVITVVRLLRGLFRYYTHTAASGTNRFKTIICCCVACCAGCCDCCLERVSKDGFIFTSIYGTNFCYSSSQAVKLLWNNVARLVIVEGISKYMEFIGRVGIAFLVTGIALIGFLATEYYRENLSSFVGPTLFIFLVSYLIASLFMGVLEVGVDTMFLCFLVDEAVNQPPRFASDELLEFANQYSGIVTHHHSGGSTR